MSWLAAALVLAAGPAEADGAHLGELLERARSQRLADDGHWLRLGHWRRGLLGGLESQADGPGFFLAPGGKQDPAAELEATLRGFFGPVPADEKAQHALCAFPARLAFLSPRLAIDPARLPRVACPRLEEWWARTRAQGITLVFSSYFLNNPASAFGHTFLRLDRRPFAAPGERVELADQGLDYAATVDTGNAVLYAVKGLFGLFHGEWSARPYFYKVREYADFESRDLWEYELDLAPAAVAMLVAHLWELGGTWFDYYYLTENCSYHVLSALEAADPHLELLRHVGKVTLPADTVKALFANPGLVRAVHYRPSIRTQLERRLALLAREERIAARAVAAAPAAELQAGLGDEGRARVLDAALDLVDAQHGRAVVRGEAAALALRQAVLERRAAIPVASPPLEVPAPSSGGPERGHGSSRALAGAGASRNDGPIAVLGWRLALHDHADPPAGFSPATQLEFLDLRLRLGSRGGGSVRLDEAALVDAAAMAPLGLDDPRPSWRLRAGATRLRDGACGSCVAGDLEVGGGITLAAGPASLLVTGEGVLQAAPGLSGLRGSGFRAGLGPRAALRLLAGERASLLATAAWRFWPLASPRTTLDVGVTARLHLGRASLFAEARGVAREREALAGVQAFY